MMVLLPKVLQKQYDISITEVSWSELENRDRLMKNSEFCLYIFVINIRGEMLASLYMNCVHQASPWTNKPQLDLCYVLCVMEKFQLV